MKEANRTRKGDIKYNITLNEEQKEAKRLILDNQITVITGRAGCGKSLVSAVTALDFLSQDMTKKIYVTRAAIETGRTLGYLPGDLKDKFSPYIEALVENMLQCTRKEEVEKFLTLEKIVGMPVQFVRGKTMDEVLVVEEAQNLTKHEMLAILTRLGKTGKMIINGDLEQKDVHTSDGTNGLQFAIDCSKHIAGINHIKLQHNHRSDLVGEILKYHYGK